MAQLWTTGPALLYCNIGTDGPGGGWIFIGTAKQKPRIQIRRSIKTVSNDLGGDSPFDLFYSGQDAIITADVNRMSLFAYYAMASCAAPAAPAGAIQPAGLDLPGETGTLLATEGQMFPLAMVFPYAPKAIFQSVTNGLMPAGYQFPLATLEGPDDLDPGTQDLTIHMVWHAIRGFAPSTLDNISTGNQLLYDFDVSGVPAPT